MPQAMRIGLDQNGNRILGLGAVVTFLKIKFSQSIFIQKVMKDKRWVEIVNASCLWPLLLGPNAFTHGRIDSISTLNLM
jgi:hypothetical protein